MDDFTINIKKKQSQMEQNPVEKHNEVTFHFSQRYKILYI